MEGLERLLCPCSSLSHVYGAFFFWVSFANDLAFPGSESVFGYLSALPCLHAHLLAKMMLLFSCSVVSNSLQPHGWSSTPGFPVLHHLPELAQTHVHRVSDAIRPSRPLLSPSPPVFSLSQHQGLL